MKESSSESGSVRLASCHERSTKASDESEQRCAALTHSSSSVTAFCSRAVVLPDTNSSSITCAPTATIMSRDISPSGGSAPRVCSSPCSPFGSSPCSPPRNPAANSCSPRRLSLSAFSRLGRRRRSVRGCGASTATAVAAVAGSGAGAVVGGRMRSSGAVQRTSSRAEGALSTAAAAASPRWTRGSSWLGPGACATAASAARSDWWVAP
eukprot:scaffold60863_cov63-Phaeocystis_antarctica.AAC.2